MADQDVTEKIRVFYNALVDKCDFICQVNELDLTEQHKDMVKQIHPETMKRYYGSGLAIPAHVTGFKILDIGCGSGSLVYVLSKLVGPKGHVTGIDITQNLIAICKKYTKYHCDLWGLSEPNIEFHCGNAEKMKEEFGFQDNSFDVIVSNGVICLCPNKEKMFSSAYGFLKEGGEFYLNDVYSTKEAPEEYKNDIKMWDLGLTGSQVWEEFGESAKAAGFTTPYLTMAGPVDVSEEYTAKVKGAKYVCAGNRMFKLPKGAHRGPAKVTYKGNIDGHKDTFKWDINLTFKTGTPVDVDAELATILAFSRYKDCFDFADVETATTKRAQNPFTYLAELAAKGTPFPYIYEVK